MPALVAMWLAVTPPRAGDAAEVDALAGWTVELVAYGKRAFTLCGPQAAAP